MCRCMFSMHMNLCHESSVGFFAEKLGYHLQIELDSYVACLSLIKAKNVVCCSIAVPFSHILFGNTLCWLNLVFYLYVEKHLMFAQSKHTLKFKLPSGG